MKIAIIGYSGSGKSTLAQQVGHFHHIPVLHLDTIQFEENWQTRSQDQVKSDLATFLHREQSWVIDGNYSFAYFEERMAQADQIIFMNFSRWNCLYRAFKRYLKYRNQVRESMASGCTERLDWEFIRWILWDGRTRETKSRYEKVRQTYPEKFIELQNQKQLSDYVKVSGIKV